MNTLFIVPTPIGNLEDITLRALRVLKEVALIAAEDTRTTRVLLQHYDIPTPATSYHEYNKLGKLEAIFNALASGDVALVSDAGTPGISDPGYELIREAIARGIRVEPLPGASAILPALVASGLSTGGFVYVGFLPKKAAARKTLIQSFAAENRTVIAYESPHRLVDALASIIAVLGDDRPVCVARELSKVYEEFTRGTAAEVHAHYVETHPRGEIVLMIGAAIADDSAWDADRVRSALQSRVDSGESLSRAAKAVAATSGWNKREVYALGVDAAEKDE